MISLKDESVNKEKIDKSIGEHVVWETGCIEEDTKDGSDRKHWAQNQQYIYGESARNTNDRRRRQSTRQGQRTEEGQGSYRPHWKHRIDDKTVSIRELQCARRADINFELH